MSSRSGTQAEDVGMFQAKGRHFGSGSGGWQSYLRDDAAGTAVLARFPESRAVPGE